MRSPLRLMIVGWTIGALSSASATAPLHTKATTTTHEEGHQGMERATFAAGCFWGVEALFRQVKGVANVTVGYTGGMSKNPTYETVCSHTTGHAEAVLVEFDPAQVSYAQLLNIFWSNHNPTTPNQQGPDHGSQYRSAIFYHTPAQNTAALALKQQLEKRHRFPKPIVTEIVPATTFYRAEEDHQRYFEKHGGGQCRINLGPTHDS